MDTLKYYDKKYFDWQKSVGEFGGKANLFKFEEYISETSDILDFGAGGVSTLEYKYTRQKNRG